MMHGQQNIKLIQYISYCLNAGDGGREHNLNQKCMNKIL